MEQDVRKGKVEEEEEEEKQEVENEERQVALIEFYSSFRDLFEFFCLNTTVHGTIRLVCSSCNKMKTAFWALLFLASFAILYWQFGLIFSQYWAYPVTMSMSVRSQTKMFPAVTLCNLNPYRINVVSDYMAKLDEMAKETLKILYNFDIAEDVLDDHTSISMEEQPHQRNDSRFTLDKNIALVKYNRGKVGFRLCNMTGGDCYIKMYISGVDAILEWYRFHYMNIMSQVPRIIPISQEKKHINEFVYACQYNGQPCRESDYRHFHHPVYGSCYTFNSDGTDSFWEALKPGILYGLSLILKVDQNDHIPLLSTVAGVKVMIHSHNQTPFLEHEEFDIRPGIETTIGIKQDEVTRLGGNYGKCTVQGEDVDVTLIYNSTYTLQACLHSCFQHQMIEICGCGYYYYPLPPGQEYCNYNKHPGWGHCFYLLYRKFVNHELNCFKKCPKPCKESWYTLLAGYAKWPSAESQGWIHRILEAKNHYNATNNRSDIAKVNIFYDELNYNSWDESPEYNVNVAMSNMGTQWSIWFGSSVLSVVEVLEFLVDATILALIFCYRWFRARKSHKMTHPPAIPSVSLTLEKYRYVEDGLAASQNAKPYTIEETATVDKNWGPPPYSKYNRYCVPELYTGVVLNGFKHRKDHCVELGLNS